MVDQRLQSALGGLTDADMERQREIAAQAEGRRHIVAPLDLSSFTKAELGQMYLQCDRLRLLGLSDTHLRFMAVIKAALSDAIDKHHAQAR